MFLRLAFRNIFRNIRRTIITEFAIIIGIVAIVFMTSYTGGMERLWAAKLIDEISGHITLARSDYLEDLKSRPLKLTMRQAGALSASIETLPEVEAVVGKLDICGLIGNSDKSTTFFGSGLDLTRAERALPGYLSEIVAGAPLKAGDTYGAAIAVKLAKSLGLKIGDSLLLATSTVDGQTNAIEVVVRAIFRMGNDIFDENLVYTSLPAAEELVALSDRVSMFNIRLRRGVAAEAAKHKIAAVARRVEQKGVARTWIEMNEDVGRVIKLNDSLTVIVGLILTFIVAFGVANTMLMTVFERTREIGTIRAVGTTSRQVIQLFCLEGVVIGTIGVLIGLVLAVVMVLILGKTGIPLPSMPGTGTQSYTIYPQLNYWYLAIITAVVYVMSVLSSMYPARVASRLDPIEALRRN